MAAAAQTHKVTFLEPGTGKEVGVVTVSTGETILEGAIAQDIPIQHACGGFCACTTCHVVVKSGAEHLSEPEEEELDRLETIADNYQAKSRLACQSKVNGDVVVEIQNLDR